MNLFFTNLQFLQIVFLAYCVCSIIDAQKYIPEYDENKDVTCKDESELIPHENCTLYYICSNGEPVIIACNIPLYFNPRKNECDFREEVPECEGGTRPPLDPITQLMTTILTTESIPTITIVPSTIITTTTTTIPTTTTTTTTTIPTTTTTTTTTTPRPTTNEPITTTGLICEKDSVYFLPKEGTCKEYFMCSFGTPYILSCSLGEHFSPTLSRCVLESQYLCPWLKYYDGYNY